MSALYWNYSGPVNIQNLKVDSSFIWLLCSLVLTISWIIYVCYYNSRVIGYILTKLFTRFVDKDSFVKVGSLTVCALSGKIMFRDIAYITTDYTVRVQDGYLIFRWWFSYIPKNISKYLSHSDTRLSVMLNGFELHFYNRCQLYEKLEKNFELSLQRFSEERKHTAVNGGRDNVSMEKLNKDNPKSATVTGVSRPVDNIRNKEDYVINGSWRDLIPVIKLDICTVVCLEYIRVQNFRHCRQAKTPGKQRIESGTRCAKLLSGTRVPEPP